MKMTLGTLLEEGKEKLEKAGVPDPLLDARFLLLDVFDMNFASFLVKTGPSPYRSGKWNKWNRCRSGYTEKNRKIPGTDKQTGNAYPSSAAYRCPGIYGTGILCK